MIAVPETLFTISLCYATASQDSRSKICTYKYAASDTRIVLSFSAKLDKIHRRLENLKML